jgi:hypothetical protein
MKNSILLLLMVVWAAKTEAAKIKGKVTDEKGEMRDVTLKNLVDGS